MRPILLVALGGNALIGKGESGTVEEQFRNLSVPVAQIARLSRQFRIIITHGNGPQVGHLLLQQECCSQAPRLPLEILVAQTQGQIGYMIESTLDNELTRLEGEHQKLIVTVLTYVLVDENDPGFLTPTKPIGPVLNEDSLAKLPYPAVKTVRGVRRVVASPRPVTIIEKREIKQLIAMGFIVIACGGGGIPVIRHGRAFHGVDAVIDKDLASAKLAEEVGADILIIATDVEGAAIAYGEPGEKFLRRVGTEEAERCLREGCFAPGSMGPKVEAALKFIKSGGSRAVICSIDSIEKAVAGGAGTEIVR
ncbi:MAG: carbamate kinase [Deltaproteobacteria bacterium]|jgi:carbamate kinase|nr:carbamate kinase [Deltaproteobacteria bacterium]MDA8307800.1 carbamate kinase [Deltaproteobacteria bacterium]